MRRVAVGVAGIAVLGLVAGGVWATGQGDDGTPPPVTLGRTQAVAALTPMSDCATLLKHLKAAARDVVGPYGLDGSPIYTFGAERAISGMAADSGTAVAPSSSAAAAAKAPDSTTNVQVAGVDESDVVKTDGDLMLAVMDGKVKIVRMNDGGTEVVGTWNDQGSQSLSLLVHGTRVVVIGSAYGDGVYPTGFASDTEKVAAKEIMPQPGAPTTRITVLDISDPAKPRVEQKLDLEGNLTSSARLVDGEIRFAMSSSPTGIPWKMPMFGQNNSPSEQKKILDRATAQNKKVLEKTTIDDWLPKATVTTDGQHVTRDLVDCPNVSVPKTFSGLQTLTMVQLGLSGDNPLSSWHSAGVLASDSTLYATADHAWLATQQWAPSVETTDGSSSSSSSDVAVARGKLMPGTVTTQIHLFDTPLGGTPTYEGSGSVEGSLINQFAMDEYDGVLRVATTTDGSTASDNRITTLKGDGEKLSQEGVLTGLGKGEQIRGVRFLGDLGYVVTFRQTDPLYTVDLADPAKPVLRGELKIPGYSAYLHPVGDGRILGLGQDGTAGGQATGLQLSLFDVSKDDPTRLARVKLSGAWSDAESDHHAFTMAGNLVLVPYSGPGVTEIQTPSSESVAPDAPTRMAEMQNGVLAVRVDGSSIGEPQKLSTPSYPLRALVHDGDVYTLTQEGVAVHRPDGNGFAKVTVARF